MLRSLVGSEMCIRDRPNIGPVAIRKILGPRGPPYPCRPLPRTSSVLQFFQGPTVSRTRPDPRTKSVHVEIEPTQRTLSETRTDQRSFSEIRVVRVRAGPRGSGRARVVEFSLYRQKLHVFDLQLDDDFRKNAVEFPGFFAKVLLNFRASSFRWAVSSASGYKRRPYVHSAIIN